MGELTILAGGGPLYSAHGSTQGQETMAHGTANTKGAYSQLLASTPRAADAFIFHVGMIGGNNATQALTDLALGPAGSERIILADLMSCVAAFQAGGFSSFFRLPIPAGVRIASRCQSNSGGDATISAALVAISNPPNGIPAFARATTYGASASTSRGVDITGGSSAKGSWVQITTSTTAPIKALYVGCSYTSGTASMLADVGLGLVASTPKIVIPDIAFLGAGATRIGSMAGPYPVNIPSGTPLAMRVGSETGTSTSSFIIIGLD